jgi:GT2 family glycosyltransferase
MKIVIGFITYNNNTAPYLPYFLNSLQAQDLTEATILVADNSEVEENDNYLYLRNNYPDIKVFWQHENTGFSRAYNFLIKQAKDLGAEYFVLLNPDMILEADFLANIILELAKDEKTGAVAPLILKWDFVNKQKTNLIDSQGIEANSYFCFSDYNSGQEYKGQNRAGAIIGFTGAAAALRVKALESIKYQNEYFDELMFMYKEDIDLSLRLRSAGWSIVYTPQAVCYHNRTASPLGRSIWKIIDNRKRKSRLLKSWSYLNQLILWKKFWPLLSFKLKIKSFLYQTVSFLFALIFETYLLKSFSVLKKNKSLILKKRTDLVQKAVAKL